MFDAENITEGLAGLLTMPAELAVIIDDSAEGRQLCSQIRDISDVPIVALMGVRNAVDRVTMLELGTDVCVTWSVSTEELVARIRSLLRRTRHTYSKLPALDMIKVAGVGN